MSNAIKGRSRVTNGKSLFLGRALTTAEARRLRDIINALLSERGGAENVSVTTRASVFAYAGLVLRQELTIARMAAGEDISGAELGRLSRDLIRARRAMDPPAKAQTGARRRSGFRSGYPRGGGGAAPAGR